ncbi:HAD family hydrolase [Paracoccus rhizosphaerae]|uniref:HAD family hydrolase n=1 Tax=Paracoccus rhizosphaerae TaxID=1133347 RepID=A0ABV6CP02_9RHOB|nr:HAD-IA family hydrolase [Paracoccus rhizosphaerae]
MRIDLIIFDCDGVIADSEILSAEVLIDQLAQLGIDITLDDVRRDFLGRSFPTVAASIRDRFARALPDDFEAGYRTRLLDRFAIDLAPTPGIGQVLKALTRPVCVATSSSPPRVARTLQLLGLTDRFGPHVFTASQVVQGKPAPDLFQFAAAKMGCAPDHALVIEDSVPGLQAARAAGMRALHYAGGAHLAGHAAPDGARSFADWCEFPALLASVERDAA